MKNHQLMDLARKVKKGARAAKGSFLMPGGVGQVIQDAADLLYELSAREIERCREQTTTEKQ